MMCDKIISTCLRMTRRQMSHQDVDIVYLQNNNNNTNNNNNNNNGC